MASGERKERNASGVGSGATGAETSGRASAGADARGPITASEGVASTFEPDPNDVAYDAGVARLDTLRAFQSAMNDERLTFVEREEAGDLLEGLIRLEQVKARGASAAEREAAEERQGELEARVANRIEPEKLGRLYAAAQRAARADVAAQRAELRAERTNAALNAALEREERAGVR